MRKRQICSAVLVLMALASSVTAKDLLSVVSSIDRAEFTAEGGLFFGGRREMGFRFIDQAGEHFRVFMDAGRAAREYAQQNCSMDAIWNSGDEACSAKVSGLIIIDGSEITLSVDAVEYLDAVSK